MSEDVVQAVENEAIKTDVDTSSFKVEKWSEFLKSPENLLPFSPSREIGDESLHGFGETWQHFRNMLGKPVLTPFKF